MKKLIKHLKENWIRYGFETLTILIGIVGALTFENWNEDRKDRSNEHILLQQLKGEFEANQQLIQNGLLEHQIHTNILYLTLNHTGPDVEMPEPEILDTIDNLIYSTVELVYGTINLILSTDQMELLKSDNLKSLLASFPGHNARYKEYEIASRDITLLQRDLHHKHTAILYMEPDMQSKVQNPHKSDYLGWLRDRDYQNIVIDRIFQIHRAVERLLDLKENNEIILKLINQELIRFN